MVIIGEFEKFDLTEKQIPRHLPKKTPNYLARYKNSILPISINFFPCIDWAFNVIFKICMGVYLTGMFH